MVAAAALEDIEPSCVGNYGWPQREGRCAACCARGNGGRDKATRIGGDVLLGVRGWQTCVGAVRTHAQPVRPQQNRPQWDGRSDSPAAALAHPRGRWQPVVGV